jgi:hypothetical protein
MSDASNGEVIAQCQSTRIAASRITGNATQSRTYRGLADSDSTSKTLDSVVEVCVLLGINCVKKIRTKKAVVKNKKIGVRKAANKDSEGRNFPARK